MKSCLGTLILGITGLAIVITVVYHTSVNSELRFETRNSHEEYINTRRSYRPKNVTPKESAAPAAQAPLQMQDDDVAEEVEP